jgi:protein tyrosine phosphatase (PTP) superfamily phosphohydrolase (DUF442 family)
MRQPDTSQGENGGSERRGGWRWTLYGSLAGLAAVLVSEAGSVFVGRNLHAVIPGRVYRCAQCTGQGLEKIVHAYGIATVVNLRGCAMPFPWYQEESRATHRLNVCQEDIALSAARLPSVHEIRRLIQVLDRTEYPILLHCRHGADRTGLASALVLLLQTQTPLHKARRQLGLRYGHIAVDRPAYLDRFLDHYEEWLSATSRRHTPAALRDWITTDSFPGECRCTFEALDASRELEVGDVPRIRVRVRNTGLESWRFTPANTAGYHLVFLVKDEEQRWLDSGRAGLLDAAVGPGQSIDVTLAVPAFKRAGHYRLMVDMLDEQQCWFYQVGTEPMELELDVHEKSANSTARRMGSETDRDECQ